MNAIQIIAATVLALSLIFNWYQTKKVERFESDISALMISSQVKDATIKDQKKEIEEMPKRYIETTRAIDKEICLGVNQIDRVMSMSTRIVESSVDAGKEVKSDKVPVVHIDDKLPADLVKLLNEG